MLNHEGSHSEYFEELCALAAGGQISEPEFVELQDHLQDCARCRSAYADFTDLLHNKLPLADSELTGSSGLASIFSKNSSYRDRFLARARKQGIAISEGSWRGALRNRLGYGLSGLGYAEILAPAMALLLVAVGLLPKQQPIYGAGCRYGGAEPAIQPASQSRSLDHAPVARNSPRAAGRQTDD